MVLLDVSDSMNPYSFFLLKFAYALGRHSKEIRTFVFSTSLVEVSTHRGCDPGRARPGGARVSAPNECQVYLLYSESCQSSESDRAPIGKWRAFGNIKSDQSTGRLGHTHFGARGNCG
ncbi:MAG: VWA domain-containing protein [Verrucomicrobia bacterium]|nr:VWA domain-containing protein [Verrucomicrobiota bacterium]